MKFQKSSVVSLLFLLQQQKSFVRCFTKSGHRQLYHFHNHNHNSMNRNNHDKGRLYANPYFTTEKIVEDASMKEGEKKSLQSRKLGSQEHLMLPRQYSVGDEVFPQMSHVSCTILNNTPDDVVLKEAIEASMRSHPLLRAKITGTGELCYPTFLPFWNGIVSSEKKLV